MLKLAVPGSVIDRLDGSSPRRPLEVEELSLVLKKIGLVNCLKKKKIRQRLPTPMSAACTRTFRLYQR